MNRRVVILMAALICLLPLLAQDAQQQKPDDSQQTDQQKTKDKDKKKSAKPANDANKPKPLFGGNVSAKSSSQKKDTTSLGFNGLDPEGKVETALLKSSPTSADEAKVEKIAQVKVDPAELQKFLDDGELKAARKRGGGQ